MSRPIFSLIALLMLSNCGRNVPQAPATRQSAPPPQTANPPQTPSPSTAPSPTTFKWTEQELSENTAACAEAGTSDFSYQSWKTFCRCTYEEAARRWTFNDFQNNFETHYDSLFNDGVINSCLSKAGIDFN